MDKLKALREKRIELVNSCDAICAAAKAEERELSENQAKIIAEKMDEVENLDADIKAIEARQGMIERVEKAKAYGEAPAPRQTSSATSSAKVEVGENLLAKDPKKGFDSPRQFLEAVRKNTVHRAKDERLAILATAGSDEQSGVADSYGGYFVPEAFAPGVLQLDAPTDPMAGRTRLIPMNAPKISFNARVDKNHSSSVSGGLTVSRSAETVAKTSSRMQFEQVTLSANSLFGLAYATEEILADSPESFAAILASGFDDEFRAHLVSERLNGTGVGQYLGVMNTSALITVSKETGQAAATVDYNNIIKMRSRCYGYENAVWMANPDVLPALSVMNISVGVAGIPAWQPSAREGAPDMLLGRPLIFTTAAKSLGTKGDIVLANWNEYLEGLYQPLQTAESIHVRFLENERAFKFSMRNDGRPWWTSVHTPENGATLSPFVTLAARA